MKKVTLLVGIVDPIFTDIRSTVVQDDVGFIVAEVFFEKLMGEKNKQMNENNKSCLC